MLVLVTSNSDKVLLHSLAVRTNVWNFAYFIGQEQQEPTLFIFDEPTTGLHFHDIDRLLHAFNALIERGHTILVIEHNLDVIKCADHVIDLGPDGGDKGGNLVIAATPEEVACCKESLTGKYLAEKLK